MSIIGEKILRFATYPIGWAYAIVVAVRNKLFDKGFFLKSRSAECATISVGNLTAGGTGKTPHTEYLLQLLCNNFTMIAAISRGHKRKSKGFLEACGNSSVDDIGDEAYQIATKFPTVKVAVDHKRLHAISILKKKYPELEAVVMDDCFQHRYIKPGISILLCDYTRPYYKDYILPYGNLRESKKEAKRADIIIISKCPPDMNIDEQKLIREKIKPKPYQRLFFTTMEYGEYYPLFKDNSHDANTNEVSVLVVSAIANPKPFIAYIKTVFGHVTARTYSDHHFFTTSDWAEILHDIDKTKGKTLIMVTEKDATKIKESTDVPDEIKKLIHVVPIKVRFLENAEAFDRIILDYVKSTNKA